MMMGTGFLQEEICVEVSLHNFHKYQVQWEKVISFEFAPKMEGSKNGDDGGAEGVIEAGQSLLNDQTFPMQ